MNRSGRLKGPGRPAQDERARAYILGALSAVDVVVVFDEDTPAETIAALKPDLLVKGADWTIERVVGAETVRASSGRLLLVPLIKDQSTTTLIRRAADVEPCGYAKASRAADGRASGPQYRREL
jgi:D-beta-D-heptose 7-phosphate kinase / D-beta-D-heptose 1-phosphate adenosyltransferase